MLQDVMSAREQRRNKRVEEELWRTDESLTDKSAR